MAENQFNFPENFSLENNLEGTQASQEDGVDVLLLLTRIEGVAAMVLSIIGIVANLISFWVANSYNVNDVFNILVRALAIFDACILVEAFTSELSGLDYLDLLATGISNKNISGSILYWGGLVGRILQTCGTWTVVLLTVFRYVAVCHPMNTIGASTPKRARLSIAVLVLASLLYNVPPFLEVKYVQELDPKTNETIVSLERANCETGDTILNFYEHFYHIGMFTVINYVVPVATLTVLNILLVRSLWKREKRRQEITSSSAVNRNRRTTLIVVTVVAFFLFLLIPEIVSRAYFTVEYASPYFPVLATLAVLTRVLNSSINFIVYCVLGRTFRQTMIELFCCKRNKENDKKVRYKINEVVKVANPKLVGKGSDDQSYCNKAFEKDSA